MVVPRSLSVSLGFRSSFVPETYIFTIAFICIIFRFSFFRLMSMSTYRNILYKYVTTVLGVFIIIFNGVKIYVIYRRKNHQSLGIIYITNLAFSDFMVGVTMVILKSMDPFMRTALADNEPAKGIYRFLRFFCIRLALFTSIFSLTAITINQLWGVIKPLSHRKLTKKTAYKTCVLIWVVSVLLVTPLYLLTQFIEGDFNTNVNLIFPVGTILGMLIFFISYSLILRKLKQNKSALIGRQNIVLGNKNQNIGNNDVQKYTSKVIVRLNSLLFHCFAFRCSIIHRKKRHFLALSIWYAHKITEKLTVLTA